MQLQNFIEMAREIIETATTTETLFQRLKGLAMDWAGTFPEMTNDRQGRSVWFDGERSVFLDSGSVGCRIMLPSSTLENSLFDHVMVAPPIPYNAEKPVPALIISHGIYSTQGEFYPHPITVFAQLEEARKYLEFF